MGKRPKKTSEEDKNILENEEVSDVSDISDDVVEEKEESDEIDENEQDEDSNGLDNSLDYGDENGEEEMGEDELDGESSD